MGEFYRSLGGGQSLHSRLRGQLCYYPDFGPPQKSYNWPIVTQDLLFFPCLCFYYYSLSRLNFKALDFLGKTRLEETSHHSIFCLENEKNVNFPIITTIILDVSNENQKNNIEETSSS